MNNSEGEELIERRDRTRQTKFGFSSQQHLEIDKIVNQLVVVNQLSLPFFVSVIEKYPNMREETSLIVEIFKRKEFIQNMIAFLLQPRRMGAKYGLAPEETARFIKNIASFMKDNLEFYELYFLALEENSTLVQDTAQLGSQMQLKRIIINPKELTLDQWFAFLQEPHVDENQFASSLGYFAQIFLPFIKYQFSLSSRVTDYYEEKYDKDRPILLIYHFHRELIEKIIKYTHYEAIFKCIFSLVLVSLEEQEWKYSLLVLHKLCQSAIIKNGTSDVHIENIYKMVKEVSQNISKDKNRTVFGFVTAIIKAKLVDAIIVRLSRELEKEERQNIFEEDWVIEMNMKLLVEIVNIYYLLVKNGIDKNANKMKELRLDVLKIRQSFLKLIALVKQVPQNSINFSNGEILRSTPLYKYYFFSLIKIFLLFTRDYGYMDKQMSIDQYSSQIIQLIQSSLAQNRWNSIMHSLIEKIVAMIITTQFFKTKCDSLYKFLDFLIEAFTNKKYVFLNSTRMANQGDIKSLYSICCKITISFEKACKSFGFNNQYEQWGSFAVNVLQNFDVSSDRTSSIQSQNQIFQSQQIQHEGVKAFDVEIDEAADMKQTINRIDVVHKWSNNKGDNAKQMFRTGSFENLEVKTAEDVRREYVKSPSPKRPRQSMQDEIGYKSGFELRGERRNSNNSIKQQELSKPPEIPITTMERILSSERASHSNSSESFKRMSKHLSSFELDSPGEKK